VSELIAAVSRSGQSSEALGGPLIYSIILFIATAFFFRDSPVGIVATAQMAAGDGLADIIGR
jgi:dolichol kinase